MGAEVAGAEARRLEEARLRQKHWKRWGPYISERAWGTVREDYSTGGEAWEFFPHDHARARAYRWGEDGLAGLCDNHQRLCLALGLWNGRDPILKERLFGLTGNEGSNGEDVKEYYFYLDSTPTHSYMRFLYKYPQAAFPYAELVQRNAERARDAGEFELLDTGVFAQGRYYDVFVEYAKAGVDDIAMRIVVHNRGDRDEELHLLPTLWCRRTWDEAGPRPRLLEGRGVDGVPAIDAEFADWGARRLYCGGNPRLLFTENETNRQRLWGQANPTPYVKDGIERWVIHGEDGAINHGQAGTKAAAHYVLAVAAGARAEIRLRLSADTGLEDACGAEFDQIFSERRGEADAFYEEIGRDLAPQGRTVQRQALAGLLWSKQFYHYDVSSWLKGDAEHPAPGPSAGRRNAKWGHLYNEDIVSMPDKWEYPWYASWDLAFHCIPLALVDIDFAKDQLLLFLREWYMHPNGQIPAYEWAFDDVNPPVHAWAVWRVYKIEKRQRGRADRAFLERAFHKLLLNFNWWVNRKDAAGNNIFEGGFLGLDNIGVFDRSAPLPTGGTIEQADGTSWMGMYCLNMLAIALELARENRAYADIASKFFEHFVYISNAINHVGDDDIALWDEEDGFFYDALTLPDGSHQRLKIRSIVGLITLFAVETLDPAIVDELPGFRRRLEWFIDNRPHLRQHVAYRERDCADGASPRRLLAIVGRERLRRVLRPMLDESEFLSPFGIRGLSRRHQKEPFVFEAGDTQYRVDYEPAESASGMFGGNSNWRGPVWFPVNFLIIESLQKFHYYYGDDFKVECPTGSGNMLSLWEVAAELSRRLCRLFLPDGDGARPVNRRHPIFDSDPDWREYVLFYEYFHGDDGAGLGASHQTGWTALVAKLLQQSGDGL